MSLKLFMIPGGAEIIAKVVSEPTFGDPHLTVEHPLVIRPIQKAPGQYMLDLFPHSLANPEGVHVFSISQILSVSSVVPEMLSKAYTERTSSIILASAMDDIERMK